MPVNLDFYIENTAENVRIVHESYDEKERLQAIRNIVTGPEKDKSRLLIELLPDIAWRETQGQILKAIGETQEHRGVEFLIRFIRDSIDLPLSTQAVLGLGLSQNSLAGEFLNSMLSEANTRLRQEAIAGLALMPHFYCDDKLLDIIENVSTTSTLRMIAIITAGRRGAHNTLQTILKIAKSSQGKLHNAALLALGHLACEEEINTIFEVDSVSKIFTDEIKLYAKDRSRHRSKNNISTHIIQLLNDESLPWIEKFRMFKELSPDSIWDTLNTNLIQPSTKTECLLRTCTYKKEQVGDHINFLVTNQDLLNTYEMAPLARLCIKTNGDSFIRQLKPLHACKLLEKTYSPNIIQYSEVYFIPSQNRPLSIAYINALVAQCLMTYHPSSDYIDHMLLLLNNVNDETVHERVIRGLAQMGCSNSSYLEHLKNSLQNRESITSVYYCIGLIPKENAIDFLLNRINHLTCDHEIDDNSKNNEVSIILKRLSTMGSFNNAPLLKNAPGITKKGNALSLLRILNHNIIEGLDEFISLHLSDGNHTERLLALGAVALNGNSTQCSQAIKYLEHPNNALRERAIHCVCLRGTAPQHTLLLEWFEEKSFNASTAIKIFSTIVFNDNDDYTLLKAKFNRYSSMTNGPFVDNTITAEVLSLSDNLLMREEYKEEGQDNDNQRHLDTQLQQEISDYQNYSETIKIILRNAELTWKHPDLFNNTIDKSGILIQFNKSVELLLQQRLGYTLFHNTDISLLPKMQSRLMELGLDVYRSNHSKLIRHLKLEHFFTSEEFPKQKLKTLTKSIMSGKIMHQRFRAIDDLRAWSLVILLFSRTFTINDIKMNPILIVRSSEEEKINTIVKRMNKLHQLRNNALHHGIIVEHEHIESIREDGFKLLNELNDILPNIGQDTKSGGIFHE